MLLLGWVETEGSILTQEQVADLIRKDPHAPLRFGGEFTLEWDGCSCTDALGVRGSPHPPGVLTCGGTVRGTVAPDVPDMDLEPALREAVALRREGGVVALSGGVDSALLAAFAGLPCITVGMEGAQDFLWAERVASCLGLPHRHVVITPEEADQAMPAVLRAIPRKTPLDLSIALTLSFVCRSAAEEGYRRVLCGQGADELFAGYARYRESSDLGSDLRRDFLGLHAQAVRDQAVAALHGTCLSYPFLDLRVVRAAGRIPAGEMVRGGVGKQPLRAIAARHLPSDVAGRGKKAMQYGSGIWRHLRRRARENGYKRSVQGYLDQLAGEQ